MMMQTATFAALIYTSSRSKWTVQGVFHFYLVGVGLIADRRSTLIDCEVTGNEQAQP
jgi:hypothetical protein